MILFLTLDGVLRPACRSGGGPSSLIWMDHLLEVLRRHPFVSVVLADQQFRDTSRIKLVSALPEPLCFLVIDSVWCDLGGFADSIAGASGTSNQQFLPVPDAIERWLELAGPIDWLAIACADDGWRDEGSNLLLTDPEQGLSAAPTRAALHKRLAASDIAAPQMTQVDHDWRSLDKHRVLAALIRSDPSLLDRAAATVERWLHERPASFRPYAVAWRQLIQQGAGECIALMTAENDRATALRQCSPFVGLLSPAAAHRFRVAWAAMRATVMRSRCRPPTCWSIEELEAFCDDHEPRATLGLTA